MRQPKILLFDIEITPNLAYVWGKYEQNVIRFKEEFQILSVSYKWLGEKHIYCISKERHKDDRIICEKIKSVIESADVVITHNGDEFDIKKINARLVFHKLQPFGKLPTVDTKKVAKRYFSFNSNSLDDLGNYLKLGRKEKHEGIDLWFKCMAGNHAAWERMRRYNKKDVILLEKVYKRLLPWIQNHPNISKLKREKSGCPNCGGDHCQRKGLRINASGVRQSWVCISCGSWFLTSYKKS